MSEEETTTEDIWTPYKELQNLVVRCVTLAPSIHDPQYHEFIEALRNHRQNFFALLKNPPKNINSRNEIRKGVTEGITLPGLGHQILSKELVDETLIISDMYDLNEFMALDLLCTAQLQMPHYPGLTRGLTAVLLYYDGRKALTTALKTLVQARMGHSWALDAPLTLTKYITEYTNKLQEDGLLDRIITLIEDMDPVQEQDLLQQNRALGGAKHHRMVMKLYNDCKQDLADILYLWSAQSSLPKSIFFRLLSLLQTRQVESEAGEGGPNRVTLTLIMAVLYAINLSPLNNRENGEDIINTIPLITERGALDEVKQKLMSNNITWESAGLRGLVQFALAVATATLKTIGNAYQSQHITNDDEILVETALSNKVFHFMAEILVKSTYVHSEEFYMRYFHTLISDFILLMPLKIKELRSRADESMRLIQAYQQEGVEPPMNLDNHFEYLMFTVAELYKKDPLKLNLAMDYWCQHSESAHVSASVHIGRLPPRQVALFKFVRLAGEILPAGLFVSYLKMIASLASSPQAARQAFNFLKPNGSSTSTTISWDHFFNSLNRYYYNLRQELPPSQDTVYRQRNHPKGITPHEVKGLEAVLKVVQVIAKYDEMSRVAICDHPNWKVLQSLIGLVSCAMPIPLKGVLVRTLAALARSPESSSTVWQSLEAAQILSTIPTTSSYQPRGVQTELEEIESRNEEYPLTRAMLKLLDVLTDYPIPRFLGVGQRNPGFDPYLHFLINTVFLRFHTRSYKNAAEKWKVANACLKIFSKLIKQYEPSLEDFMGCKVELQGGDSTVINSAPGYHLMTQLHSANSELLHVILYILDEGFHQLDTYDTFPGKKYLERGALCCLEILDRTLKMQHQYMTQLAAATTMNKIITGLSRLLLGVNMRTGKPDHMINIANYVSYNSWLPRHAFVAVGVIQSVANEPGADLELLSTFTATNSLATNIRHGFVESLDMEYTPVDEDDINNDEKTDVENCKERILLLLMQSITRPVPNLAHYLLGFKISKDIRKTIILQPGILGSPRTCLHSILGILEQSFDNGRDKITEMCYCYLHTLAANNRTSVPVLRFLRTAANQDFVQRHLSKLPFQGTNKAIELGCMSWLLKITAIQLRVSGGSLQSSLVQRLVGSFNQEKDQSAPSQKLLMDLLHYIDFQLYLEPPKSWEFFDPSQIEMVFGRCSVPSSLMGWPRLIDVRKLHSHIMDELTVTQNSATVTQRKLMQQELQSILAHALKKNQTKLLSYATVKFVEGWCQTTEILFSVASNLQLPATQRQSLLLNLSHDLLQKMTSCEALSEIKTLVSGIVLMLLVNLRNCFAIQSDKELLPTSPSNTTMMKIILSHVLEWILSAGASSQKVLTHLYAALLNFLCVIGVEKTESASVTDTMYVSQLDSSFNRSMPVQKRSHCYATIQVINSFGNQLIDVLCHNCSGGHDVCKMLALSCLDKILELDYDNSWMIYLASRGYLKHMIDSLLQSDNLLRLMLQPEPETLRPLYLYEAKLATFCRMASTRLGAENLLKNKVLSCMSSMCVFDQHPDVHISFEGADSSFVPSIGQRYQQIFLPALYLCGALLTTLGTENQSCAVQVCTFLQSHRDTVEMILRNAFSKANTFFLKEIACLTSVVARSANIDVYKLVDEGLTISSDMNDGVMDDNNGMRELRAHLYRLQKLMLSLLHKFQLQSTPIHLDYQQTNADQQQMFCIQIVANVLLYARNQMQHGTMDQKVRNVLFEPYLSPKPGTREGRIRDMSGEVHLGLILEQLTSTTSLLHNELPHIDSLIQKSAMISDMTAAELKKYMSEEEADLDIDKQRIVLEQKLNQRLKEKRQSIKYCCLIIEQSLYLLWSHLDFYTMQIMSGHKRMQVSTGNITDNILEKKVSPEILTELKQGLVAVFTDSFITQLLDTQNDYTTVDRNFIEALVRRIKRLLQFIIIT